MIPHGLPAQQFIDHVNFMYQNDGKRCRILLAELLLRVESLQNGINLNQRKSKASRVNSEASADIQKGRK